MWPFGPLVVLTNQWRMAVCEFGVIKGLLFKENCSQGSYGDMRVWHYKGGR